MSGNHAMGVCLTDVLVQGCDASLSDVCLAFTETFVRMAGGVIYGIKPAAIFSIPMRAYCAESGVSLTIVHSTRRCVRMLGRFRDTG